MSPEKPDSVPMAAALSQMWPRETHFLFCQVGVEDLPQGPHKGHEAREGEAWHLVGGQSAFAEHELGSSQHRGLHGSPL